MISHYQFNLIHILYVFIIIHGFILYWWVNHGANWPKTRTQPRILSWEQQKRGGASTKSSKATDWVTTQSKQSCFSSAFRSKQNGIKITKIPTRKKLPDIWVYIKYKKYNHMSQMLLQVSRKRFKMFITTSRSTG